MSKYRRAAKTDTNQNKIVTELRSIPGVTVQVGHDDILVGYRGKTFWYELKSPEKVGKRTGKILESAKQPSQVLLEKNWAGHYKIISSVDEILTEIEGW